jgi:Glycosyl transferase family 2
VISETAGAVDRTAALRKEASAKGTATLPVSAPFHRALMMQVKKLLLNESVLTRAAVRCLARPGPIAMLMVVRDEIDIIEQNIDFHRRLGIEHFVVTDNGSVDGTRDVLAEFIRRLGKSIVVIDDAEPGHHQSVRVNRMIQIAKKRFRPRWIISSDADEFWYPASGRYDSEIDGRKNILNCFWHNFLPRPDTPWQQFTDVGEMPGYHARMSKAFCLARGLVGMYSGNHESRSIPRIASASDNIRVYHYPVRSYEQFERKVVQGHRAALKASFETSAAWHWAAYYEAWEDGRLPQVYQELASRNRISEDRTMADLFTGDLTTSR